MGLNNGFVKWVEIAFSIVLALLKENQRVKALSGPAIEPSPLVINSHLTLRCSYDQIKELIPTVTSFTHIVDMWIEQLQDTGQPRRRESKFVAGVSPLKENRKDRSWYHTHDPGHSNVQFKGIEGSLAMRGKTEKTSILVTVQKASCVDIGIYEFHLRGRNGTEGQPIVNYTTWLYLDTLDHTPNFLKVPHNGSFPLGSNVSLICVTLATVKNVTLTFRAKPPGSDQFRDLPLKSTELLDLDMANHSWPENHIIHDSMTITGSCTRINYYSHHIMVNAFVMWPELRTEEISCVATATVTGKRRDGDLGKSVDVTAARTQLVDNQEKKKMIQISGARRLNIEDKLKSLGISSDLISIQLAMCCVILIGFCILLAALCKPFCTRGRPPQRSTIQMHGPFKDIEDFGNDDDGVDDKDESSSTVVGFSSGVDRTRPSDYSINEERNPY